METLILALLGTLYIALSPSNSDTKDKNKHSTVDSKAGKNKETKNKALYNKLNNMTEYEIDKWLKDKYLYNTYGNYRRQTKINKIIEKYKYLNL